MSEETKKPGADLLAQILSDDMVRLLIGQLAGLSKEDQAEYIKSTVMSQIDSEDMQFAKDVRSILPGASLAASELIGEIANGLDTLIKEVANDGYVEQLDHTVSEIMAAKATRRFNAFVAAGFSEKDAIRLTTAVISQNPLASYAKR